MINKTQNFKVLMPVLHYYPVIGGLEQWTQNIAERLAQKIKVFIITGKVENQPLKEELEDVKILRTSLFSLKNLSYSSPIYILTTLPFIFFKSLNILRKEKINLLHCQGFLGSFLGYLLYRLTKTPYIITVQRLEENRGFLRRLVYKNAKICIAASSAIKEYFREIGVKEIEIIPNGIDLDRFESLNRQKNREELGLRNEFVIMSVARLEKVKGIKYLIKSASFLKMDFKLLLVGDGSEKKDLEKLTKELNLEDKIRFLGQIKNEDIPKHLSVADCFVLPSLREGFGIVILEAIAAGIPVIATRVGGILDIIEDGKSGILIESKNPEQIAKAILRIYSQPEFAKSLVQNAENTVKKYNWDNISQQISTIYSLVLNRNEEKEILTHPHDYKNKNDWKRIFNFLEENLDYHETKDFLDLGAGIGNIAFHILNKNPKCNPVCLDINQNYLNTSKQRHPKIRVLLYDINQRLPFEDNSFDLVSCVGTLHSQSIKNVENVLKEVIRVSKKYLLLDFFLKHTPYVFLERIRYPENASRRYGAGDLQRLFSKLNLKVIAKVGMRTIFPKVFPFSGKTILILLEK